MPSFSQLSPHAGVVTKIFVYGFGSAPTADLVAEGERFLLSGGTPQQLCDFLFHADVPGTPYPGLADSTDARFVRQLVECLVGATDVAQAKRESWVADLLTMKAGFADRATFAIAVAELVETLPTEDADLLAVRASLAQRLDRAAAFAVSDEGATYDGGGFGQLQAGLRPPDPVYRLEADLEQADEGAVIVYTLETEHVPAGTRVPYAFSGEGITPSDLDGGALEGQFTVGPDGRATLRVGVAADARSEGRETLVLTLGGHAVSVATVLNDTSVEPAVSYRLSASESTLTEGAELTVTLATTGVPAGTTVAYTIEGTGLTADDLAEGALTGAFTVDGSGQASVRLVLRADATTEGLETLRLALDPMPGAAVAVLVRDTSRTPEGGVGTDTFRVPDVLHLEGAGAPVDAAHGEIRFDSSLTYDLLDQGGRTAVRMSVADLRASGSEAGAPLVTTNQSADRGNLPQVANAGLLKLDLGDGIDRVDYSAEQGRVIAVVAASPAALQRAMVNDDGSDEDFSGPSDRVDELRGVEEVVASAGGGTIDLTATGRDWVLAFSEGFATDGVDAALDRAVHRIVLQSPGMDAWNLQYLEIKDAGLQPDLRTPTAAWTRIEGGDRAESLQFTSHESTEARVANLRGGDNAASYADAAERVQVSLALEPFVASVDLADDRNTSGTLTAVVGFVDAQGRPLSGTQAHTITAHTPDHGVAAGSLRLTGSDLVGDAVDLQGVAGPLHVTLGLADGAAGVRLLQQPGTGDAFRLEGFERVRDNGGTDDVYHVQDLTLALQGPRLEVGEGSGRDTLQIGTEALGHAALGRPGMVDFAVLTGRTGFDRPFAALDITGVEGQALTVRGTAADAEVLVVGPLDGLVSVSGFEELRLSDATLDAGRPIVLDLDRGRIGDAAVPGLAFDGRSVSAEGASAALTISVSASAAAGGARLTGGQAVDRLTGGLGADVLRGGAGDDLLDGGLADGTVTFVLSGRPDAATTGAARLSMALDIASARLTLDEAAVPDTQYGDGRGAVRDGASLAEIGAALAGLVNARLEAAPDALPPELKGARFDAGTGALQLSFAPGSAAPVPVRLQIDRQADTGTLAVSAPVRTDGGAGADRFIFEASGALNGTDTIVHFMRGDRLDVTAFTGTPIVAAATPVDGQMLGGPGTVHFIVGRSAALSADDFAASAQPGRFVLADGVRAVVAVTADRTGERGDAASTPVSLYYVDNGAEPGVDDLTVSLVGLISGPVEPALHDLFGTAAG